MLKIGRCGFKCEKCPYFKKPCIGCVIETCLVDKWRSTTEECSIAVDGRSEDVLFKNTVYTSKPEVVEDLVNNLFDVALTRGARYTLLLLTSMNIWLQTR
ncbi:MAG: hypothetical protein QXN67_11480 [Thermoproteota archaeon]